MPKSNSLSVVIVTFNNEKTIKGCLDSLFKSSQGIKVVVVDNNSQDKTKQIIKEFDRKVTLIESKDNLGFAKANNWGEKKVDTDYVIFLNPDTKILRNGSLEKLRDALAENPQFGLIGPQLIFPSGNVQKSVRNLPTPVRAFKEYVLGNKGAYDFYLPKSHGLCEIESVVGACIVMRKDVFEKIGGFDERYFLYFEDLQLCKDIRKMGCKVGYLPMVTVEHLEGGSGPGLITLKFLHVAAKRYHGLLDYYLIQAIIRVGNILHE